MGDYADCFTGNFMCLVAILVQLSQLPSDHYAKLGHVALALLTIVSAWLLCTQFSPCIMHMTFIWLYREMKKVAD